MIRWEDLTPEQQQALQKWATETFSALGRVIAEALEGLMDTLGPELVKLFQEAATKGAGA